MANLSQTKGKNFMMIKSSLFPKNDTKRTNSHFGKEKALYCNTI